MKRYLKEIVAFFVIFNLNYSIGLLPPNIPICRRNDPNLGDCIVRAVQSLAPRLGKGDLGNGFVVPPIEPFFIKELNFGEDRGLKVFLYDVNIHGASKLKIEKLRINLQELKLDILLGLPKLDVLGKYKMSINFLGQPLKSEGDYQTQFMGAKMILSLKAHPYSKNGVEYIRFDPFVVKFNRGKVSHLKIGNLFGGNKVLGEIVHTLLTNNEEFLLRNIYPSLEAALSRTFTSISNKIVEKASYDELFPL